MTTTTRCNACGESVPSEQIADRDRYNTGGDTICVRCHLECCAQPSRDQIAALQDEAVAAGDDAMAAICAAALDGDPVAAAEATRCLREAAAQRDA